METHSQPDEASPDSSGKGVLAGMLLDPLAETKDIALARRAIRERWRVPEDRKDKLVERLFDIVEKESVTIMTKDGPAECDDKADSNAVAAARVIVAIEGQKQADEHPQPTVPGVAVQINNHGVTAAQVAVELLKTAEGRAFLEG